MSSFNQWALGVSLVSLMAITSGCGGGGSDSLSGANRLGTVSFAITDAPVTDAKKVLVAFNQVQIKHQDEDPETFDVTEDGSSLIVDLLTLQGIQQQTLVQNVRVKAGDYEWIRFLIDSDQTKIVFEDGDPDYDEDDEVRDLEVPSGHVQLIGGFTVPADGEVSYTIDFDLRHSIVCTGTTPQSGTCRGYKLKPVLRMTNNAEVGHISGSIDNSTYDSCAAINDDPNNVAVTLFAGDTTANEPEDDNEPPRFDDADNDDSIAGTDANDAVEPITAGIVSGDAGSHTFEIGYVTAGTYQLVLTCGSDDPLADDEDDDEDADLVYTAYATVAVAAGETTVVTDDDFIAIP